ncbi:hypothetical protein K431DRAFT_284146 [Polychaeton citri CBS 116435]|uniref:Cupin type-1 domain-containing protein n=1 Tax=Polychaeton citri CBS 116435 TaxID=1314669 RepID=A0A9P4QA26_9PEZI|nr:hypothetical protein K431DRAFT_284146 [Polychaeton citri CBS 116435]
MVTKETYHLSPTPLIPNSPYPLIHYRNLLADPSSRRLSTINALYAGNGWQTQWIFRYGATQRAHYHSATHECMAVLSGTATIRFGAGDTDADMEANTHGAAFEPDCGVEVRAEAGDVFIIPAGVSHKTFDTKGPDGEESVFRLLTPGDGHKLDVAEEDGVSEALDRIQLTGFTMMGAYPVGGVWDFAEGGEHSGKEAAVWSVPRPVRDPVLGDDQDGVCGVWK